MNEKLKFKNKVKDYYLKELILNSFTLNGSSITSNERKFDKILKKMDEKGGAEHFIDEKVDDIIKLYKENITEIRKYILQEGKEEYREEKEFWNDYFLFFDSFKYKIYPESYECYHQNYIELADQRLTSFLKSILT